jgi:hypothetical protein
MHQAAAVSAGLRVYERAVASAAKSFADLMEDEILGEDGIATLRHLSGGIAERAREASSAYTKFLSSHFAEGQPREDALTSHAAHNRIILSRIAILEGYMKGLSIHADDPEGRKEALRIVAYLRAQCETMEGFTV